MDRAGLDASRRRPSVLLIFHCSGDKRVSVDTLPPLGILSIAAYLEKMGIHTDVIDFSVDPKAIIRPDSYDVIGFSINIGNKDASLREIERVHRSSPSANIIVGGPLCMSDPEAFTANPFIDAVFACEGEEALLEYLTTTDKTKVKGVYVRVGFDVMFGGDRKWISDLDALPFPALDKVPIRKYNNFPKRKRPIASMMTSRGCPFGCIFCSHAMGRKWRALSAERVIEEIRWMVYTLGVKEICIYDDNFLIDRKRAESICDGIISEKIPVILQFSNGLRADSLDPYLLEKLRKAGTWLLGLAPETGNPDIMKRIKKGFNHQQVNDARYHCRRLGITTHGFFMIGFPFESRQDIEDTVIYAKKLDCEIVEFNKVIPYRGTELYNMLLENEQLLTDPMSVARSYHEGTISTHRVGDLGMDEVKAIITSAYRQYYFRPKQMFDLLRTFSIRDLLGLTLYALRTGNV